MTPALGDVDISGGTSRTPPRCLCNQHRRPNRFNPLLRRESDPLYRQGYPLRLRSTFLVRRLGNIQLQLTIRISAARASLRPLCLAHLFKLRARGEDRVRPAVQVSIYAAWVAVEDQGPVPTTAPRPAVSNAHLKGYRAVAGMGQASEADQRVHRVVEAGVRCRWAHRGTRRRVVV